MKQSKTLGSLLHMFRRHFSVLWSARWTGFVFVYCLLLMVCTQGPAVIHSYDVVIHMNNSLILAWCPIVWRIWSLRLWRIWYPGNGDCNRCFTKHRLRGHPFSAAFIASISCAPLLVVITWRPGVDPRRLGSCSSSASWCILKCHLGRFMATPNLNLILMFQPNDCWSVVILAESTILGYLLATPPTVGDWHGDWAERHSHLTSLRLRYSIMIYGKLVVGWFQWLSHP
jgi:hypothetical protein